VLGHVCRFTCILLKSEANEVNRCAADEPDQCLCMWQVSVRKGARTTQRGTKAASVGRSHLSVGLARAIHGYVCRYTWICL